MQEFQKDVVKSSLNAVKDTMTMHSNGTSQVLTAALLCRLCVNMVKNNAIPVATLLGSAGCSVYVSVPMYKSIRKFVKEPWKVI